jgi:hypothetical protein
MEGEPDLAAIGAGGPQQLGGIGGLGAELGREMEEVPSTGGVSSRTTMQTPSPPPVSSTTLASSFSWSTTKVSTL